MSLDPDDPRPPYQQIASALRAAILTRKIGPGEKLPSQHELSQTYGVARMTIQQALRVLKEEGLTVSRQGSGVFARVRTERPVGLRPHIEAAFEAEHVTVDFVGYTAETLHGVLAEPLDKVRAGRLTPKSLQIRLLLSDMSRPPVNLFTQRESGRVLAGESRGGVAPSRGE
ncbi:GntR family transcriptional regulator [Nocardioides sp. NPDC023903]|uniref:GntR family transcriptional regulator n=1 Tax=Nocardioides sp. NPDC023903 TaxID=3157195 RepID=UPI003405185F